MRGRPSTYRLPSVDMEKASLGAGCRRFREDVPIEVEIGIEHKMRAWPAMHLATSARRPSTILLSRFAPSHLCRGSTVPFSFTPHDPVITLLLPR